MSKTLIPAGRKFDSSVYGRPAGIPLISRAAAPPTPRAYQPTFRSPGITIARTRADGVAVEVLPDGSERPFAELPMRQMTDEEIHAAAILDPDAQPLTQERLAGMRRVPRTKALRRALGLTQEAFAARYQIPLGTLRDWEQGRTEPDQPARAYLRAIAGDPEAVQRALMSGVPKPARVVTGVAEP